MTMSDDEQDPRAGALTTGAPRAGQVARRDFTGSSLSQTSGAAEAMAIKARADTEARWIMAMNRPRHPDDVRDMLMRECRRPAFADVAIYRRPVGGGKVAEGLSIRFAEVAMRCMGNMSAETTTIFDDDRQRIVRVTVTDFESNGTWQRDITIAKTVERRELKKGQRPLAERVNSYGDRVYLVSATDDEVRVKEAAEISKAVRTLILRVIPGHLQDEAREICAQVAKDRDAKDPAAARNRMLDAFSRLGVRPTELERWLGHGLDTLSPAERDELVGLGVAIRDGETTWADALAEVEAERAKAKPAAAPPVQAQATDPGAPAAPAASKASGKGTGALKGALRAQPAAAPAQVDLPPNTPPPPPGMEDRPCAGCGDTIEVKVGAPPGQLCGTCSRSE